MASPLTLYVQLKQDAATQIAAKRAVDTFRETVEDQFDELGVVHFASMMLIPNPENENGKSIGNLAILVKTDYDGTLNEYIGGFWESPNIRQTIVAVQGLALYPGPEIESQVDLENYVNEYNLSPPPADQVYTNFYEAHSYSVKALLDDASAE